jgi:nickel transport protein
MKSSPRGEVPGSQKLLHGVFLLAFHLILYGISIFSPPCGFCHTIHYSVEPKGMTVRVFYSPDDPASYAEYEVFGPGDTEPYQIGRTDRSGCVSLLPDRPGEWKVKVLGESAHGFHGITIELRVDEALMLEGFTKPLVATHTKVITGVAIIFGIFGLYALWRSRKGSPGRGGWKTSDGSPRE